jgi:1-acyl-sn-glycerol-3-phosphate acyltransferase
MWAAGARLDIRGLEKIDWKKPHVFVVNHQSMIDIAVLQLGLPANLRFISKVELLNVPFMGAYMRNVGMIAIDRGNSAEAIARLDKVAREIAGGTASVVAFAEGTRSRTGAIQPFKKGAFMLALTAQIPVVPVSIEGAIKVLPPDGFKVRPGVIRLDIGDPIPTAGMTAADRDRLIEQAHAAVVEMNVAAGGLGVQSVEIGFSGEKRGAVPIGLRP